MTVYNVLGESIALSLLEWHDLLLAAQKHGWTWGEVLGPPVSFEVKAAGWQPTLDYPAGQVLRRSDAEQFGRTVLGLPAGDFQVTSCEKAVLVGKLSVNGPLLLSASLPGEDAKSAHRARQFLALGCGIDRNSDTNAPPSLEDAVLYVAHRASCN